MAAQFGINLVFFDGNEAEYGNPFADVGTARRGSSYFAADSNEEVFISGVPVSELIGRYGLEPNDMHPYLRPDPGLIERAGVEVHYLGHYLRWRPQSAYYYAAEHGGFEAASERTPGTYSNFNSVDDKIDDLHYWTTHVKSGIGRATCDAAQEIRNGVITREKGVALVRRLDVERSARFEQELVACLSIPQKEFLVASTAFDEPVVTVEQFLHQADEFRSPHLWPRAQDPWRPLETPGDPWRPLETPGDPWRPLETPGDSSIRSSGRIRVSANIVASANTRPEPQTCRGRCVGLRLPGTG